MGIFHRHQTQRVPSDPHWTVNCTAYCMAMFATDTTLGGLVGVTGRYVRAISNEPIPDPASPGLNLAQMKAVAAKLRISFTDHTGNGWDTFGKDVGKAGGRRAILQVDYDVLQAKVPALVCQRTGDFDHAILVVRVADTVMASDPLCANTKEYPVDAIRAAAEKFGRDHGMVGGGLYYAVSRDIPHTA